VALQSYNGTTQEVRWEHTDPSNASYVQTGYNGAMYYDSQAELDPLGSNVGTSSPNSSGNLVQNASPGGFGYGSWGDPFGSYSCRMDGFEMPCSMVMQSISSGAAYFAPPGAENPFVSNGQGRFVPNPVYGNPSWSDYQWQCCDNNGNYYPVPTAHMGSNGTTTNGFLTTSFVFTPRRISEEESVVLKDTVKGASSNTDTCKQYIKDLIERVASNARKTVDDIVSTDVEELFDIVLGSRGDNPDRGDIYITGTGNTGENLWKWVNGKGFAQINLGFAAGRPWVFDKMSDHVQMNIISTLIANNITNPTRGMTVIHELMHVAVRALPE
jgi:hypothetical protein